MNSTNVESNDELFPKDSFCRVFWLQQLKAAKTKNKKQVRWHPLIVRWCLAIKLSSSAAYRTSKDTSFLTFPSERTLRNYTHIFQPKLGIQPEVNNHLADEVKLDSLEEFQKCVCVIFDEVRVKEGHVLTSIRDR